VSPQDDEIVRPVAKAAEGQIKSWSITKVQPRYDTLVRGIGRSSVNNGAALFGNANVGNRSLTNLQVPRRRDVVVG